MVIVTPERQKNGMDLPRRLLRGMGPKRAPKGRRLRNRLLVALKNKEVAEATIQAAAPTIAAAQVPAPALTPADSRRSIKSNSRDN